jgi:ribonuclease D|tara:strand:+ start:2485 stop:3705 length:1221 start_codon:yes stop_codon:yes gene_type:complete
VPTYEQSNENVELIADTDRLAWVVESIHSSNSFGLDLEFITEGYYSPKLALVQVAWGHPKSPTIVIIDPFEVDIGPIADLVADPQIETIIHAAQADLQVLADTYETVGQNVIDTQIAAAFAGYQDQIGYASLVEKIHGTKLSKASQFSDWEQRPLATRQLHYAQNDVRYLSSCWAVIKKRLQQTNRLSFVASECEHYAQVWSQRPAPEEMYLKVEKMKSLRPKELGVLKYLADWRERRARILNVPRTRVISDRTLIEIARAMPDTPSDLEVIRGMSKSVVTKFSEELLRLIDIGKEQPLRLTEQYSSKTQHAPALSSIVSAIIGVECKKAGIAARFVATRKDIDKLIHWYLLNDYAEEPDLKLLQGWRRELVGELVLDWLRGRISISANPESSSGITLDIKEPDVS